MTPAVQMSVAVAVNDDRLVRRHDDRRCCRRRRAAWCRRPPPIAASSSACAKPSMIAQHVRLTRADPEGAVQAEAGDRSRPPVRPGCPRASSRSGCHCRRDRSSGCRRARRRAPAGDVHSTVWSAPASAVGGWFVSVPASETSTTIGCGSSGRLQGPPTPSQSGESRTQATRLVPCAGAFDALGVDRPGEVAVEAAGEAGPVDREAERRHRWCRGRPCLFDAALAAPDVRRRSLRQRCRRRARSTIPALSVLLPDSMRSLKVGSDAHCTSKVIGFIASWVETPTTQSRPGTVRRGSRACRA